MSKYTNFDSYKFYVTNEETQKREEEVKGGKKWQLFMKFAHLPEIESGGISKLEFFEN